MESSYSELFDQYLEKRKSLQVDGDFKEEEHPRGQPKNAGQFVKKGTSVAKGGGGEKKFTHTIFYRGTVSNETKRIKEPFEAAKGKTFVARHPESARLYGENIEKIEALPNAKILFQENPEFWKVIGKRKPPNESMLSLKGIPRENISDAIKKAEQAGYDAISFKSDSDIGTVILNENVFKRESTVKEQTQPYSSSVQFKELNLLDKAKVNLINRLKMSENQVRDMLTFEGYKTVARYDFPKSQRGVVYIIANAKTDKGDLIETTFSVDEDRPDDIHLNYLEVSGKGHGTAKDYLKRIEAYARATGKKTLSLDADISIGRYAWAKLGFEPTDPDYLRDMKRHMLPYVKKVLSLNGQKDYSKEIAQIEKDIAGFKKVEDVCDYHFPDTDFTHEQLKKIGYMNDDVPDDLKMHLGKSYMTHQKLRGFTGYTGVKTIGKTGDSMGAFQQGELETRDTESKSILIVSDPDHGVKEGQSDYEFHKDMMEDSPSEDSGNDVQSIFDRFLARRTTDAQVHAPKGGVSVKGKHFKGGEFIPKEGGYQEAYKEQKKKEEEKPAEPAAETKTTGKEEPKGQIAVPPKLKGNFDMKGDLSNVKNWKAKVMIRNSAREDDPKIGEFGKVRYIMFSNKSDLIVPIAIPDEHQIGYELMGEYQRKGLLPKEETHFTSVCATSTDFFYAETKKSKLAAYKKFLAMGGDPNLRVQAGSGSGTYLGTVKDFVDKNGEVEFEEKGQLKVLGKNLISKLEDFTNTYNQLGANKNPIAKEKIGERLVRMASSLITTVHDDSYHLGEYGEVNPLTVDTTKKWKQELSEASANKDYQRVSEIILGINGLKNSVHNVLKMRMKKKGYDTLQYKAYFGDLNLAVREFDRLGSLSGETTVREMQEPYSKENPDVLKSKVVKKYGDKFLQAVENTEGAKITPEGLELDISRFQKPEQHGEESVRKGVFYLPEKKSPYRKYYSTGKMGYGGGDLITGHTVYKNPLIVEAGTGGTGVVKAYDQIKGKKAYENMRKEVLAKVLGWNKTLQQKIEGVKEVLQSYGGDPSLAYEIVRVSTQGNTLPYAVQEHIAGAAIRDAGYDAVIGYSKAAGEPRLAEVFDLRQEFYPEPDQTDFSNEEFYKTHKLASKFIDKKNKDAINNWVRTSPLNLESDDGKYRIEMEPRGGGSYLYWLKYNGRSKMFSLLEDAKRFAVSESKKTTDAIFDSFLTKRGVKVADAVVHAPKGGVTVKGKKFIGGQFIPKEGGYQQAYLAQQGGKVQAQQQSKEQIAQAQQQSKKQISKAKKQSGKQIAQAQAKSGIENKPFQKESVKSVLKNKELIRLLEERDKRRGVQSIGQAENPYTESKSAKGIQEIDVTKYPEKAEEITPEMRESQAEYGDIIARASKNINEIRTGTAKITQVSGKLTGNKATTIKTNAENELNTYTNYLATDTALRVRDFIDNYKRSLERGMSDGSLKDVDAGMLNSLSIDCIQKIMHQEVESNRQQFTDHGVRHIVGDMKRSQAIAKILNPKITGREALLLNFIVVNHDIGYTTPLIREGGVRGVGVSKDHPKFSQKITGQQEHLWDQGKIFSKKEFDQALEIIGTHDDTKLDKADVLGTSMRLADNLSLFSNEKLPSAFKYVKGGDKILIDMGIASKNNDTQSFDKLKADLHKKIETSRLNENLKRDLKSATNEISYLTPKYTMGVLAGGIDQIKGVEGKVNITVKYDRYDKFLQKIFDMGQRQTKKLLEDYGIKDFNKPSYELGDFVRLNIVGAKTTDSVKNIFDQFLEDRKTLQQDGEFKEDEHPRGQPKNKGQFVKKGTGTSVEKEEKKSSTPAETHKKVMGININDDIHPFTQQILSGKKTIETRKTPTLRPYIGNRIGLIRTSKKGKAMLVGYATISKEKEYNSKEDFDKDYDKHLIDKDSPYYIETKKYGYELTDVKKIEPIPVDTKGIISRQIPEELPSGKPSEEKKEESPKEESSIITPLVKDAVNQIMPKVVNRKDAHEILMIYDKSGTPLSIEGGEGYVNIDDKDAEKIEYALHNHPSSASFSNVDVTSLIRWKNWKRSDVVAKDGTFYSLEKDEFWNSFKGNLTNAAKKINRLWFDTLHFTMLSFKSRIDKGENADAVWKEHTNLIMERVAAQCHLKYTRILNAFDPKQFATTTDSEGEEEMPEKKKGMTTIIDDRNIMHPPYDEDFDPSQVPIEEPSINLEEEDNNEVFDSYLKNRKTKDTLETTSYQGLPVVIENPVGSIRKHKNGITKMFYPYGYIKKTVGRDGDEIDCFIGNDPYAANVFVIKIGIDDREDKVMLGFSNEVQARDAFLAHYDDQKALGEITEMPIKLFREVLENKGKKGINLTVDALSSEVKSRIARMKEMVSTFPSLTKVDDSKNPPPDNSDVDYKDFIIKVDATTGEFDVYSIGGAIITHAKTLEIAKQYIDNVAIEVKQNV